MQKMANAQFSPIQIAVINESTVLKDVEVVQAISALQKQVTNDFRPAWGMDAELRQRLARSIR